MHQYEVGQTVQFGKCVLSQGGVALQRSVLDDENLQESADFVQEVIWDAGVAKLQL